MITVLIFFAILVLLVLIHEFGHFIAAKKNGVYVEEFGFGFPPKLFGKKIGETLYSFNLIPLGGFVKLYREEYHENGKAKKNKNIHDDRAFIAKNPLIKTIIILGGVIMNFVLGWVLISYLLVSGVPTPDGISVVEVQKNSPASAVGLEKKDVLVSITVDDKVTALTTTYDLVTTSQENADKPVLLTVLRRGKQIEFTITPRSNPPKGQGSLGIVINQMVKTKSYPWYSAPFYGLGEAFSMTRRIIIEVAKIPVQLLTTQKTNVEFTGPIGIAQIVGEARQYGIKALLELTALLSLNLAVFNILPFPALDGGRLVFVAYEWLTKKRPNEHFEKYMNLIGIILLLSLSVLVTINDIRKIWG